MAQLFKLFGSIQKVEDNDDGTITVYGIASSGSRDHADEIVAPEAMKAALPDYTKFPALREMHQPLAAGRVTEADVDDDGITNIAALVVDPTAITKVRTGVYAGFSIGGKVTKRDAADRSIITGLKLIEISLVDSPCNPDAVLSMWKADTMSDYKPSSTEVIARAKQLAKAAGHQRFKDCLFEASQELISEQMLEKGELVEPPAEVIEESAAIIEEPAAVEESVVEAAVEEPAVEPIGETAADEGEHGGEGAAENDEIEAAAPSNPLTAALEAAINKGNEVIDAAAPSPVEEQPGPFADLGKVVAALKGINFGEGVLAKGLYSVSRFADLLESFVYLQSCIQCEANYEGDGSPVPAKLAEALTQMGVIFVALAQEEIAEMLAGMNGEEGDIDIVYIGDEVCLANTIVDAVKADADLMARAAERVADPAGADDSAEKVELAAENERLTKALEAATPAVEQLTKRFEETIEGLNAQIGDLTTKFEALDQTPLPPKTAGPAATRTVGKSQDSTGTTETDDRFAGLTPEQFEKAWNGLSQEERGLILVKASLANPHAVATR